MSKLFDRTRFRATKLRSPRREAPLGTSRPLSQPRVLRAPLRQDRSADRCNPAHTATLPAVSITRHVKRTIDVVLAVTSLILLAPLVILVAIAISLDSPGPIFRRETLYGYADHPIRAIKFRTMEGYTEPARNRSYVTLVGRVIRRTGIDELPQLINVLLGEMSIVGPRAYTCQQDVLSHQFAQSLKGFKPGLTGWGQLIEARDRVLTVEQRIAGDLHYANNWSLLLDFKILLMTFLTQKPDVTRISERQIQ